MDICGRTSLLPGSCVCPSHPAVIGVLPALPATEKASMAAVPESVVPDAVAEQAFATAGGVGPAAHAEVGALAGREGRGEDLGPSLWIAHALGAVQGDQRCAGAAGYRVGRWLGAQAAQQLTTGAGATHEPAPPPRERQNLWPEEAVL